MTAIKRTILAAATTAAALALLRCPSADNAAFLFGTTALAVLLW